MPSHDVLTSSVAVLADEPDGSDEAYLVNGVAVPEDVVAAGMAQEPMFYPGDVLAEAAGLLEGKPVVRGHPGVTETPDGIEVDPQPPVDEVVGTVVDDAYEPGVGLLYQAEIKDPDIAQQVERGLAEVSPIVARDLGDPDPDREARPATAVHAFRDLGVVARGALQGNSIEPGEAAAMSADALAAAFGGETESEPDESDDPAGASSSGRDTNEDTDMSDDTDLTDKERELLAQANQADDPAIIERGAADRLSEADALLAAADDVDADDVTVVAEPEYDALAARVETVESMMDSVLVEETGLKESTVDAMSFEAKAGEFEDEDGEFDVDALVQTPETGGDPDDDPDEETGYDALSADEQQEADLLEERIETFEARGWDAAAETNREKLAELTGDDSILEEAAE